MLLLSIFLLALACLTPVWAQDDAELRAKVENLYERIDRSMESKDIDAYMTNFSSDFTVIGQGLDVKKYREVIEKHLFGNMDRIRAGHTLGKIDRAGKYIKVLSDHTIEWQNEGDTDWTKKDQTEINLLVTDGDAFKLRCSAIVNKERLDNIQDCMYQDVKIGHSFSVPEGWILLPVAMPQMLGGVTFLAPDSINVGGFFGYLELPYNIGAKEAIESDDAAMKKLVQGTFELIQSGPTKLGDLEAYESLSRFSFSEGDKEQMRRRIYFTTGGLLYVFIYDVHPADQWDKMESSFQTILDSFSLTAEAKENAVSLVRESRASGEVVDRIYNNDELGCQIAAPEGWSLESSTLSEAFMFNVNIKPPKGNSVVRFLAVDTKGIGQLEIFVKQQMDAVAKLGKDVENGAVEETLIGGITGNTFMQQFTLEGFGSLKRKNVMVLKDNTLYLIICDAMPPSEYDSLKLKFDEIIQSFTIN